VRKSTVSDDESFIDLPLHHIESAKSFRWLSSCS